MINHVCLIRITHNETQLVKGASLFSYCLMDIGPRSVDEVSRALSEVRETFTKLYPDSQIVISAYPGELLTYKSEEVMWSLASLTASLFAPMSSSLPSSGLVPR